MCKTSGWTILRQTVLYTQTLITLVWHFSNVNSVIEGIQKRYFAINIKTLYCPKTKSSYLRGLYELKAETLYQFIYDVQKI